MSGWIRAPGSLWHRHSLLGYVEEVAAGQFRLICGETLSTKAKWEEAVDEEVPPDDQHAPCRDRSLREAYWRGRIRPGELTRQLTRFVAEAEPDLKGVIVDPPHTDAGLWIVEIGAANMTGTVPGAGVTPADAIGDMMASIEGLSSEPT